MKIISPAMAAFPFCGSFNLLPLVKHSRIALSSHEPEKPPSASLPRSDLGATQVAAEVRADPAANPLAPLPALSVEFFFQPITANAVGVSSQLLPETDRHTFRSAMIRSTISRR